MGEVLQNVDELPASKHPSSNAPEQPCVSELFERANTAQSVSVYPLATVDDNLQSVDRSPASKHFGCLAGPLINKTNKQTNKPNKEVHVVFEVHARRVELDRSLIYVGMDA